MKIQQKFQMNCQLHMQKYLPQFKEKIEELKAKGVHSTDPVVMDLMEHGH